MIGPRGILILIAGAGFASSASMRILEPILPAIGREFSRNAEEVAVLSVAFTLAYAASQLILGPIGDSRGKLRIVLLSLAALAVTTLFAARATDFPTLLALRLLTGAFAGGIIPLCIALYGDMVPIAERQVMLARFMIASVSGQMVGSTASGILADIIGWRGVLTVAAIFGFSAAIAIATVAFRLPESRRPLSLAGAIAGYRQVIGNPRAFPLFAVVALEGLSVYGIFPYIAAILEHRSGLGAKEAGFVVGGFAVGGLLFGVTARTVLRQFGASRMALLGGVLMWAILAVFAAGAPWLVLVAGFVIYGFGFYCLHSTLQTQATELSQTARGSGLALFAASLFIGVAAGPILFGYLMRVWSDGGALFTFGAISLLVALATPRLLGLSRTPRAQ